jgi:hypothetical protein
MRRLSGFALVASWLLVSSPAAGAFDVIQITDNGTEDAYPAISGSNVVWHGCDGSSHYTCLGGDWEIYLWDGVTTTQITDNSTGDGRPDISGSNVVWMGSDGNDQEIYFWDGSLPIVPVQITDNSNHDAYPAISGSNVVWQMCDVAGDDSQCNAGDTEIYFWDGSFPVVPIQITANSINDRLPAISGSNVVWEGYEDVTPVTAIDIYFWDGSFPITPVQITDNDTLDWRPDISGSTVVWVGRLDGQSGILRWDGSFPVVPSAVSVGSGEFAPAISGSNVAWRQGSLGSAEIYFSNGVTTTNVSNWGGAPDEYPDISGSNVVWQRCVWDDYWGCVQDNEIYMTTVTPLVPSMSLGGIALLAGLVIGTVGWLIRRQRAARG